MMEIVCRNTRWGKLAKVQSADQKLLAEVMHFEKNGTFHMHNKVEMVRCIAGSGHVVVVKRNGEVDRIPSSAFLIRIPPGRDHRMEPGPDGMTCILWYERDEGDLRLLQNGNV